MKTKLIILLFFITPLLFSQSENIEIEKIPDQLIGSCVIDQPGEGQIPSQIFRWKFKKTTSNKGECEFHWLFKRQEDPEYITVGVAVYDFYKSRHQERIQQTTQKGFKGTPGNICNERRSKSQKPFG